MPSTKLNPRVDKLLTITVIINIIRMGYFSLFNLVFINIPMSKTNVQGVPKKPKTIEITYC